MNINFLEKLLEMYTPSGREVKSQKMIIEEMKDVSDGVITHHSNSVINLINKESSDKILLVAHIDEIGYTISNILDSGLAQVIANGGVRDTVYAGQQVKVITSNGIVNASFGIDSAASKDGFTASKQLLDFGTNSKDETLKLVSVGDSVIHKVTYQMLANDRITARALDDRIGVFVILETLKAAKQNNVSSGVYAMSSVGEETTLRGANFASDLVHPSCAIVVDVTYTTDVYGSSAVTGDAKLGGGPVLIHNTFVSDILNEKLEEAAKKEQIGLQYEVASRMTHTDADKIYFSGLGTPTALVSIPLRYMHSPAEIADLKDVKDCIKLLTRFILDYKYTDYNPFH